MTRARSYSQWLTAARSAKRNVLDLGDELRARWPDWKDQSDYDSWEECCLAELGITANALRGRRRDQKARVSVRDSHTESTGKTKGADGKTYPARSTNPDERKRRSDLVANLYREGYHVDDIAEVIGTSRNTVHADLQLAGIIPATQGRSTAFPKGYLAEQDLEIPDWHDPKPEQNVIYLKAPKKTLAKINSDKADAIITDLIVWLDDLATYDLTPTQKLRLAEGLAKHPEMYSILDQARVLIIDKGQEA